MTNDMLSIQNKNILKSRLKMVFVLRPLWCTWSLGNIKSLLKTHLFKVASQINNYYLLNHYRVFTDILIGVLLYYILFVQRL